MITRDCINQHWCVWRAYPGLTIKKVQKKKFCTRCERCANSSRHDCEV